MRRAFVRQGVLWCLLGGVALFVAWLAVLLQQHRMPASPKTTLASVTDTYAAPDRAPPLASPSARSPTKVEVPAQRPQPQVVIIIDDIGHQWAAGERSVKLKGDVTLAILPFSPYAKKLAHLAHQHHKELMLHAPMEPEHHHSWKGGLSREMGQAEINATLLEMIAAVPGIRGVNNHMGSALTQNPKVMDWVMQTLDQQGLFFIDSRTSAHSQALNSALNRGLPALRRDVFLDNLQDSAAIKVQLNKLVALAQKRGFAVGIGHPYPETLSVLEGFMDTLDQKGVSLVPASQVLVTGTAYYAQHAPAAQHSEASIKTLPKNSKSI